MSYKRVLPEYPSIRHLPWCPNSKGDKIADETEVSAILSAPKIYVQEKIDGANCGMTYLDGFPVVRNRTKILRKGQEMKNPSLKQFASVWNWMHDRQDRFAKLLEHGPYSVYGEWMIQQHGMVFDKLPEWFVAYDIYDFEKQHFLDPGVADGILKECGFCTIPIEFGGDFKTYYAAQFGEIPKLDNLFRFVQNIANMNSHFAIDAKREGIVIKVSDGEWVTDRFKMVRQGFDQGCLLTDQMKRNKLKFGV